MMIVCCKNRVKLLTLTNSKSQELTFKALCLVFLNNQLNNISRGIEIYWNWLMVDHRIYYVCASLIFVQNVPALVQTRQ